MQIKLITDISARLGDKLLEPGDTIEVDEALAKALVISGRFEFVQSKTKTKKSKE